MTEENAIEYCKAIDRYKTPLMHAYPAAVYFLARMIERNQWELKHQFKAIMLGSEKLYDFQRETLKRVFNAPVCHWYGQAEQVVLAGNLRDDDRFHTEALYGFSELVTEQGHPSKPGETGEIIGTGFWNTVTPMIRYRTLDQAESASDFTAYPGKGIFTTIHGRMQDVVVSSSGALMSLVGLAPVMAQFNEIENFRFIQEVKGKLELLYVPTMNNSPEPDQIRQGILKALGDEYEVIPVEVSEIPPSPAGKNTFLQQKMDITPYY
jgi:phenylacetate-CoA ligase